MQSVGCRHCGTAQPNAFLEDAVTVMHSDQGGVLLRFTSGHVECSILHYQIAQ